MMAAIFWPAGGIKVGATPAGGRKTTGGSSKALPPLSGTSRRGVREREFSTLKSTETSFGVLSVRALAAADLGLASRLPSARAGGLKAATAIPAARTVARPVMATDDIFQGWQHWPDWSCPTCHRVVFFTFVSTPVLRELTVDRRSFAKYSKVFEISVLCASSQAPNVQHAVCFAQRG